MESLEDRLERPGIRRILLIAVALLAILPQVGGLGGEYIEDDIPIIRDNPDLREGESLWRPWTRTYWRDERTGGLYRPLTVFSYGIDRRVWGADETGAPAVFGLHLTNLLLHALTSVLVFLVIRGRGGGSGFAFVAGALFATHPVHVESVVHLVGRADVMTTLFFLAAFYLHSRTEMGSRIGAPLCYFAALLSKEMAATLPAVLLVDAWLRPGRATGAAFLRGQVRALWPYIVAFAVFMLIRGLVIGPTATPPQTFALYVPGEYLGFENAQTFEITFTMLHAFLEILGVFFVPVFLCSDYSGFPHHTGVNLPVALGTLALVATIAGAAWARWRRRATAPAFWLSWLLITLLPVSNLIVISGIVMAERTLYLPSVAVAGFVGWGLATLARSRPFVWGVAAAIIVAFGVRTAVRAPVWNTPRRLYETTAESGRYPGHLTYSGLASDYIQLMGEDPSLAAELRQPALEAARKSLELHTNLYNLFYVATLAEQVGELQESLVHWEHLRRAYPENPEYVGGVRRLVTRLRASGDVVALGALVHLGDGRLRIAHQEGDGVSLAFWLSQLPGAFTDWVKLWVKVDPPAEQEFKDATMIATRIIEVATARGVDAAAWRARRDQLFRAWIPPAVEARRWAFAMEGCRRLVRVDARNPILARHGVASYEGALLEYERAGKMDVARKVAAELRQIDPGNAQAARILGP